MFERLLNRIPIVKCYNDSGGDLLNCIFSFSLLSPLESFREVHKAMTKSASTKEKVVKRVSKWIDEAKQQAIRKFTKSTLDVDIPPVLFSILNSSQVRTFPYITTVTMLLLAAASFLISPVFFFFYPPMALFFRYVGAFGTTKNIERTFEKGALVGGLNLLSFMVESAVWVASVVGMAISRDVSASAVKRTGRRVMWISGVGRTTRFLASLYIQ
eukprot:gnl/Dysnectes_brevis/894_a989_3278.p1 GENE.gnl/Dysnectes_brevis/894_a989_3278~~gnl/Dysnectes_brevis/894_a989_3278.p1  ORF type:complete len:241 (+),score=32.37 gnl/Dysnectes_brevis/894_a989_3278:83-724(+)